MTNIMKWTECEAQKTQIKQEIIVVSLLVLCIRPENKGKGIFGTQKKENIWAT